EVISGLQFFMSFIRGNGEENRQTLEVKCGLYNNEFKLAVIQMVESKAS
ncbi:36336_t:CDS:1, partial [Gigaspora margarita]